MCSYKFHKLATHPHPTFTAPQTSSLPSITPIKQGKHMWLIVRQLAMITCWWDAHLAHWDLAKAISITTLTTALATVYFFNNFCLSEEMKGKCIVINQKQIIMKIIIWWQESYKTLMWIWKDSCEMVLASSSVGQTRSLALNFKTWGSINVPLRHLFSSDPLFQNFGLKVAPHSLTSSQKGTNTISVSDNLLEGLSWKLVKPWYSNKINSK